MTLRILWASDAIWATSGYSVITRQTVPRLAALGYNIATLATFGLHGSTHEWRNIKVYPGGNDPFGNDVIKQAAMDWKADIVITLKDSFVFNPQRFEGLRWCPMTPVDHDPAPPAVVDVCRHAYRPIAYAMDGWRKLHDAGLDPLYAPHTYDPAILNPQDKLLARKFLDFAAIGIPEDAFVLGTVAVNRMGIPSRKAWAENLQAFALFSKNHPDVYYYLHTNIGVEGQEGAINLPALGAQLGITDRIIYCDQERYKTGYPDEYMNAFYNSLDALNAVSVGEGFGIPTLEAQAVGRPVIVGDWTASAELCFAGWKVPNARGHRLQLYDNQGSYIHIPEPESIAEQMELAYQAVMVDNQADVLQQQALQGAKPYQINNVVIKHWLPLLDALTQQIADEPRRGVLRIVRPEEVLG